MGGEKLPTCQVDLLYSHNEHLNERTCSAYTDTNPSLTKARGNPGTVACVCNTSTWGTEAGRALVPGQGGLSKTNTDKNTHVQIYK